MSDQDVSANQSSIFQDIETEIQNLKTGDDLAKLKALGKLAVSLSQLQEDSLPDILIEAFLKFLNHLNHDDVQILSNAFALVNVILQFSSGAGVIFATVDLVSVVLDVVKENITTPNVAINGLSCLAEAIRGHEERSKQLVAHSSFATVLECCFGVPEPVIEAAVDVICCLGSHADAIPNESHPVEESIARALGEAAKSKNNDIKTRSLLALGMILPSRPHLHETIATDAETMASVRESVAQTEDLDAKVLGSTLVKLFMRSTTICREVATDIIKSFE